MAPLTKYCSFHFAQEFCCKAVNLIGRYKVFVINNMAACLYVESMHGIMLTNRLRGHLTTDVSLALYTCLGLRLIKVLDNIGTPPTDFYHITIINRTHCV